MRFLNDFRLPILLSTNGIYCVSFWRVSRSISPRTTEMAIVGEYRFPPWWWYHSHARCFTLLMIVVYVFCYLFCYIFRFPVPVIGRRFLWAPEISLSPTLSSGTRYLYRVGYRSASLVTVCGDFCQARESLLVSSAELAHLRTVYFALYRCTHYHYYYVIYELYNSPSSASGKSKTNCS